MVEFNGYLTGSAEKYFHKKSRILGLNIILISMLLILPVILSIGIWTKNWGLILLCCILFTIVPLLVLIPKTKKERLEITPKKIFAEDGYIVCIADRYTESRMISEVKIVREFTEFYEIVFPFGRISDKFICQKDLITKGTTQDFEALFSGKIVRV